MRIEIKKEIILVDMQFWTLCDIIEKNKNKILPEIENIEKIECLNTGTIQNVTPETSVFSIQLQITYREVY